ncbi:hypothetical protein [Peribacillus asahii]|uniref:hypothetical protein n=1 Tax=Peribacillus asahii TaxID=228899 RepID=UPI0020793D4F|nr:hypothetical protein [Peribacillus asahii]USK68789.1 hypothetical protein LIS76_14525 [Peribacillus asahii]
MPKGQKSPNNNLNITSDLISGEPNKSIPSGTNRVPAGTVGQKDGNKTKLT